jgi:hypothetical protein
MERRPKIPDFHGSNTFKIKNGTEKVLHVACVNYCVSNSGCYLFFRDVKFILCIFHLSSLIWNQCVEFLSSVFHTKSQIETI